MEWGRATATSVQANGGLGATGAGLWAGCDEGMPIIRHSSPVRQVGGDR